MDILHTILLCIVQVCVIDFSDCSAALKSRPPSEKTSASNNLPLDNPLVTFPYKFNEQTQRPYLEIINSTVISQLIPTQNTPNNVNIRKSISMEPYAFTEQDDQLKQIISENTDAIIAGNIYNVTVSSMNKRERKVNKRNRPVTGKNKKLSIITQAFSVNATVPSQTQSTANSYKKESDKSSGYRNGANVISESGYPLHHFRRDENTKPSRQKRKHRDDEGRKPNANKTLTMATANMATEKKSFMQIYGWLVGAFLIICGSLVALISGLLLCYCGDKLKKHRDERRRLEKYGEYERVESVSSLVSSSQAPRDYLDDQIESVSMI